MLRCLTTRVAVRRSSHYLASQRLFGSQSEIKEQIKGQYDSSGAVIFYKTVMGGGEGNIHYGIATKPAGEESVKELSRNTVNFMGTVLQTMTLGRLGKDTTLVDVGSGHGGAAHDNIQRFGCKVVGFNLCERQNAEAEAEAVRLGIGENFSARQGDFDQEGFPEEWKERFDAAWSEEVFCHSVDKPALLKRVASILKPGGSLVFTDIMAGEDASAEDLQTFTDRNATSTMFRPSDYVAAINDAGLTLVNFTDLTEHLPFFFNGMIRQIDDNLEDMVSQGVDRDYIGNFRGSLVSRVEAHSRGCFAFGVFGAKKSGGATGTALGLGSRQKAGGSGVSSFQISGRTYSTFARAHSHSSFRVSAMASSRRGFSASRDVNLFWGTPPTTSAGTKLLDLFWRSPFSGIALAVTGGSREGRSVEFSDPRLSSFLNGSLSSISEEDSQWMIRDVLVDDCYAKVLPLLPDQGANIVDVGANIGMFAVWLANKKEGSTVLCLEPMPPTFAALSKNVSKMKADKSVVKPVPMGLSGDQGAGKITFTNFEDVPSCSTARPEDKFNANIEPLLVPSNFVAYYKDSRPSLASFVGGLPTEGLRAAAARAAIAYLWRYSLVDVTLGTLDEAYKMAELEPPSTVDLLKVDVEGLEMQVLKSVPAPWWPKIRNCIVEVHDIEGRLEEMKTFLSGHNFTVDVVSDDFYNDEVGMNHFMLIARK